MADRVALIVDDDPTMRELLTDVLRSWGWRVLQAADGAAALHWLGSVHPVLIIVDLVLPEVSGEEFLALLAARNGQVPRVVVVSADRHAEAHTEGLHVDAIVEKPFDLDTLYRAVNNHDE